jgi:hypothetical protein
MKMDSGKLKPLSVTLRRPAKGRASKGDGPGRSSFEARAKRGHLRMTDQH